MKHKLTLGAILVAATLAAPAALADWGGIGTSEPDTTYDAAGGYMYADADASPSGQRVYFNGYAEQYPAPGYRDNPNSAHLGSRILSPNLMSQDAILGVWKDCNADGYIGLSDTSFAVYAAAIVDVTAICPAGGDFNDGTWVREFLTIGNTASANLRDDEAQVWADVGEPGGDVHFDCPHEPLPWGTTGSTGGVLMWADCFTAFTITQTFNTAVTMAGQDDLAFDDPYHPERECDSPAQQDIPLWGNPQRDNFCGTDSYGVFKEETPNQSGTAFDCSAEPAAGVRDPTAAEGEQGDLSRVVVDDPTTADEDEDVARNLTDDEGWYVAIGTPAPSLDNPTGSYYQLLNQTENYHCGHAGLRTLVMQNFVGERLFGSGLETNFAATNPADGKRIVDFPMSFSSGVVGTAGVTVGERQVGDTTIRETRVDQPVQPLAHWNGQFVYLSPTYNGGTVRNDLSPVGSYYVSLYARVGVNTTSVASTPSNAVGLYASEVCAASSDEKVGNWDCNEENWYRTDLGGYAWPSGKVADNDQVFAYGPPVVPGVSYHLRDVDCYDGSVARDSGVYLSPAPISAEGACPSV